MLMDYPKSQRLQKTSISSPLPLPNISSPVSLGGLWVGSKLQCRSGFPPFASHLLWIRRWPGLYPSQACSRSTRKWGQQCRHISTLLTSPPTCQWLMQVLCSKSTLMGSYKLVIYSVPSRRNNRVTWQRVQMWGMVQIGREIFTLTH